VCPPPGAAGSEQQHTKKADPFGGAKPVDTAAVYLDGHPHHAAAADARLGSLPPGHTPAAAAADARLGPLLPPPPPTDPQGAPAAVVGQDMLPPPPPAAAGGEAHPGPPAYSMGHQQTDPSLQQQQYDQAGYPGSATAAGVPRQPLSGGVRLLQRPQTLQQQQQQQQTEQQQQRYGPGPPWPGHMAGAPGGPYVPPPGAIPHPAAVQQYHPAAGIPPGQQYGRAAVPPGAAVQAGGPQPTGPLLAPPGGAGLPPYYAGPPHMHPPPPPPPPMRPYPQQQQGAGGVAAGSNGIDTTHTPADVGTGVGGPAGSAGAVPTGPELQGQWAARGAVQAPLNFRPLAPHSTSSSRASLGTGSASSSRRGSMTALGSAAGGGTAAEQQQQQQQLEPSPLGPGQPPDGHVPHMQYSRGPGGPYGHPQYGQQYGGPYAGGYYGGDRHMYAVDGSLMPPQQYAPAAAAAAQAAAPQAAAAAAAVDDGWGKVEELLQRQRAASSQVGVPESDSEGVMCVGGMGFLGFRATMHQVAEGCLWIKLGKSTWRGGTAVGPGSTVPACLGECVLQHMVASHPTKPLTAAGPVVCLCGAFM
jgi:hypothetical protein